MNAISRRLHSQPHRQPHRHPHRRHAALAALASLSLAATGLIITPPAQAVSTSVVISEVYGGGGNTGATYLSDFVELANLSGSSVDVTGWRVQYFSATGTSATTTTLSANSVAAKSYFLVKQANGANTAGTAVPLPTPDASGTTAMSGTNGRVVLLDAGGTIVDAVSYGSSTATEGSPTPSLSNTTSASRIDPCVDTDNNLTDFTIGAAGPQNSASPVFVCSDGPPPPNPPESIAEIQAAAHLSPLRSTLVNGVEGVVTVLSTNGFWMQDLTPDENPATSEGLFVFTRTAPAVAVGDAISVDGAVTEFRPGGSGGNDNTTITEIVSPVITVVSSGNALPTPVVIGEDRIAPQQVIDGGDPGNVENATAEFLPERDAIDFYEALEGMLVGVRDAEVVGPTASFGEIPVVPGANTSAVRSGFNGVVYGGYDQPNAMRVQLDDLLIGRANMPNVNVGDTLPGLTSGVIDYSFSNYKLLVSSPPATESGGMVREVAPLQKGSNLSVASFNVENLDPSDAQDKFDRIAAQIITNLRSPDIIAMEEVQDNNGASNDAVVDSTLTTDKLIAAIAASGGPAYAAVWVNPADDQDGGEPGGNIRNVFLYRTDRDITFVSSGTPSATTASIAVANKKGQPHLNVSPGRIDPTNPAWEAARKPLVGEFLYRGATVFVAAVHFSSKGGDDPLFGRWQDPVRFSEAKRIEQATAVRTWADQILAIDPRAKIVVAGDVNDFEFSQTTDEMVDILEGTGLTALTDLPRTLPASERWTYVFEGNSQVLDHILVSQSLASLDTNHYGPWRPEHGAGAFVYDIVHTNSAFWDQDSDHDPQVVHLDLKK